VLRKLNKEVGRLESVISVPTLVTNQYVNGIVALHPESNAGTDVSMHGS